ncbi:PrpF domain-containing protein [Amorphus sp. MBR-141]
MIQPVAVTWKGPFAVSANSQFNMDFVSAKIIRGGSSKGVYLEREDLPPAGPQRDAVILKIFGSPDARQIDGLGGADKLTSKVGVMGPPTRDDCDIDFLFGQVNQALPKIDWTSNCGNLSSGAAYYAALKGMGRPDGDALEVRIHQVNLGRRLIARVPLRGGAPDVTGDYAIGGVPGTSARLDLDFVDFAGAVFGKGVLPTGNPIDRVDVDGLGPLDMSLIDMANFHIFVRAEDVGLAPDLPVAALQADEALVQRLENTRAAACRKIGFGDGQDLSELMKISVNPLLYVVAPPRDYTQSDGATVSAEAYDLFSRSFARFEFSKAYPASGSIATTVATGIPGTVSNSCVDPSIVAGDAFTVRTGHPSGILAADAALDRAEASVAYARIGRTARLLMDGKAFFRHEH